MAIPTKGVAAEQRLEARVGEIKGLIHARIGLVWDGSIHEWRCAHSPIRRGSALRYSQKYLLGRFRQESYFRIILGRHLAAYLSPSPLNGYCGPID
jgi:hypothetical protein